LGVFSATTWLNLITIGACARATYGKATVAAAAPAVFRTRRRVVLGEVIACLLGLVVGRGRLGRSDESVL
jgi:hypothetical protein